MTTLNYFISQIVCFCRGAEPFVPLKNTQQKSGVCLMEMVTELQFNWVIMTLVCTTPGI